MQGQNKIQPCPLNIQGRVISGKQRPLPGTPGLTRGFHDKTNQLYDRPEKQVRPQKSNLTGVYHDRIKHVVQSCFQGKRLVVFSGGNAKNKEGLINEIKDLYNGGASGSIIGRNSFQRPEKEALNLLNEVTNIYKGK